MPLVVMLASRRQPHPREEVVTHTARCLAQGRTFLATTVTLQNIPVALEPSERVIVYADASLNSVVLALATYVQYIPFQDDDSFYDIVANYSMYPRQLFGFANNQYHGLFELTSFLAAPCEMRFTELCWNGPIPAGRPWQVRFVHDFEQPDLVVDPDELDQRARAHPSVHAAFELLGLNPDDATCDDAIHARDALRASGDCASEHERALETVRRRMFRRDYTDYDLAPFLNSL